MPQAIVDPAELRRFAQNLKRFTNDLQSQISRLHGQMVSLGGTWRDQEQQKFADEFEDTIKTLKRFTAVVDTHAPFLFRKADRVEEYLQQR